MTEQARKLARPQAFGSRPNTLRAGASGLPRRAKRVMVVDDDPVSAQVVSAILSSQGYEVSVRGEALGTLAAVAHERPDVVILDVHMPGLSGGSLARLLSTRVGHVPRVILHSSRPSEELRQLASESSAVGAIEKGDPRAFLPAFQALIE
jgi:two-component system chemotaxis sensor kinase CheA